MSQNTPDLQGKTALITGASRGIGAAIASELAHAGAAIALHYGHDEKAAGHALAALPGSGHRLFKADLQSIQEAERLLPSVHELMNGIDIVVNNAGIYDRINIQQISPDQWQDNWLRQISVNLTAPAMILYHAARLLPRGGRIINISSRGAFRGEPDNPAYAASKAGLNALGQSLAQSLGSRQIAVYTIAPGYVETDMTAEILASEEGLGIKSQSSWGRVAQAEEIARTALFLAGDNCQFLTGSIIDVNGASYLRS